MIEPRGEPSLVEEHLHERGIFVRVAQLLDDDELVEARRSLRGAEINVGHSSVAERRKQSIFSSEKIVLRDRSQADRRLGESAGGRRLPLPTSGRMTRHPPFLLRIEGRFKRTGKNW